MQISVKGEYALHALIDLALQRPGEPVKIADIARRQKIPQKFLELILAGLKQGGFVESRRGAEGGYMLAQPSISLSSGHLRHVDECTSKVATALAANKGDAQGRCRNNATSISKAFGVRYARGGSEVQFRRRPGPKGLSRVSRDWLWKDFLSRTNYPPQR